MDHPPKPDPGTRSVRNEPGWIGRIPHWPGLLVATVIIAAIVAVVPAGAEASRPASDSSTELAASGTSTTEAPRRAVATTVPEPSTTVAPTSIPVTTEAPPSTVVPEPQAPATTVPAPVPAPVPTPTPVSDPIPAEVASAAPAVAPAAAPDNRAWLAGVPYADQIDWVIMPGAYGCAGHMGAAWWPTYDTITFHEGVLLAEWAPNQICVSIGAPNLHDVALHEAAHWYQSKVIGVTRIHQEFGGAFPINSQADYQRFTGAVLEPLADCLALQWGASWINYGCPPHLAGAYAG